MWEDLISELEQTAFTHFLVPLSSGGVLLGQVAFPLEILQFISLLQ